MHGPTCIVWANLTPSSPQWSSLSDYLLTTCVAMMISSIATPAVLVAALPVSFVFWKVQNKYRQSARELKRLSVRAVPGRLSALSVFLLKSILYGALYGRAGRLTAQNGGFRRGQSIARSPIFAHFNETIASLSTIRAFKAQVRKVP
jgi:hypothetical protein